MHSSTSYGCSRNLQGGEHACDNKLRAPKRVAEEVLLDTIYDDLYTNDNIALFVSELEALLKQQQKQENPELEANRRALAKVEDTIANIMTAIKAGIITNTTKTELMQAEAQKTELEAAVKVENVLLDGMEAFLPSAAERYREIVGNLRETLQHDIPEAHQHIKNAYRHCYLVSATGQLLSCTGAKQRRRLGDTGFRG
jgi:site-specific DNA recombinase